MLTKHCIFFIVLAALFCCCKQAPVWVIAGNFQHVYQPDRSITPVSNIALWNGQRYYTLASSIDGAFNVIREDKCGNIWAGGNFTTIDGIYTGPFARFNMQTKSWSSATAGLSWTGSHPNSVWAITTDCTSSCDCDVYIGGYFNFVGNGVNAANIAVYNTARNYWADMGGVAFHGIDSYVNTLYKLEQDSSDRGMVLWVGGAFHGFFKFLDLKARIWYNVPGLNGAVWSIKYQKNTFSTDDVFLGGEFSTPFCQHVCNFNRKKQTFNSVGSSNFPSGVVKALGLLSSGDLFAGGAFVNGKYAYISKLGSGKSEWANLSNYDRQFVLGPVWTIDSKSNVVTAAGLGFVSVYDNRSGGWSNLPAPIGTVQSVRVVEFGQDF